jgi:hypothetical protein
MNDEINALAAQYVFAVPLPVVSRNASLLFTQKF